MLNPLHTRRFGRLLARAAVALSVAALVCVPAITRIGQKLETASQAPSFSKNIDCPPKKVTVASVWAATSPVPLEAFDPVTILRFAPVPDARPPRAPFLVAPRPLRAPPSALLA